MQQAVLELYPEAAATYEFINRRAGRPIRPAIFLALIEAIDQLPRLRLRPAQREFLQRRCPGAEAGLFQYLQDYRFDPSQLDARLDRARPAVDRSRGRGIGPSSGKFRCWRSSASCTAGSWNVGWSRRGQEERLREKSADAASRRLPLRRFRHASPPRLPGPGPRRPHPPRQSRLPRDQQRPPRAGDHRAGRGDDGPRVDHGARQAAA